MNLQQLGVQLIWTIGQVTVVLSVGVILYLAARRRGPAMRSLFAGATLAIALAMAVLVLSPWPRWYNVSLAPAATESPDTDADIDEQAHQAKSPAASGDDSTKAAADGEVTQSQSKRRAAKLENPTRAALSAFWQALHDNLSTPTSYTAAPVRREGQWPAVLAVIFLAGMGVAIVRLLVGMWAVARYRRRAAPIRDEELLAELAELQRAIGCRRGVTLCESSAVGAPATIGWRRPLVLLPAEWRDWNPADRRAVLAHEIAHVARGDYVSGLVARLATALHFYHPLAHWLARRMRFEQELAADACGVACSGGKESYVVALARMALAQDNRALAWAARPFLPNRSTFLRRIEMLRNTTRLDYVPFRPATRRLVLGALVAVALLIAGLRGPIISSNNVAEAQQAGGGAATETIDLKGVPEDTVVYAVIRPAAVFARDAKLREMVGAMEKEIKLRENAGISPSEVEEFRLMAVDITVPGERIDIEPVMVVRTTRPEGWKSLAYLWKDAVQAEYRGQKYSRTNRPGGAPSSGWSSFVADEHTLVFSPREQALKAYIDAVKDGGNAPRWADEFKRVQGSEAAFAADVRFFGKIMEADMQRRGGAGGDAAVLLALAPLWRQTNTLVAGATVDGTLKAAAHAICKSEKAADEVAATVTAARVLAQNLLPAARAQMGNAQSREIARFETEMLDLAEKFLAQIKPERDGNVVTVKVEGTEAFGPLVASLVLPAVGKAREAAQRAQSSNNLKQIALALHNYADVHKSFPPAVVLGPDGKTPHSWRVAILPYIEGQELYNQYKLDEPWDSENNMKLLAKMPATFRHPSAPGIAGNRQSSSYYVLTGKGAIFNSEPAKTGTNFSQIRDGTSNTLLAVEAKRDIPWTKPEDIPFDIDGALPKLGGFAREGFAAALADGSVRFVAAGIDPKIFKAMFTAGGGEPVTFDQLNPPGARSAPQGAQRPAALAPPTPANRRQ